MASEEHLQIIRQGVSVWNEWRKKRPQCGRLDLCGADLSNADLQGSCLFAVDLKNADLHGANLRKADLGGASLIEADLRVASLFGADLRGADLSKADLRMVDLRESSLFETILTEANLSGANLENLSLLKTYLNGANLSRANLNGADLSTAHLNNADLRGAKLIQADLSQSHLIGANLSGANLFGVDLRWTDLTNAILNEADLGGTLLLKTDLRGATLTGSRVYGASVWDIKLNDQTKQQNIVITPDDEAAITVDDIEVAQFIYLLLNNQKIRKVIDTITSKAVLILGRFSEDRKPVLDAVRNALRSRGFLPIVFDFERPKDRDFTETIMTLAGMCCFVIADITNPKSAPLELQAAVPDYMIPFVRILQDGEPAFSMFLNLQTKYDWVLDQLGYDSSENLIGVLDSAVINPALEKRHELELRKAQTRPIRHVSDYLKPGR
jgi:uncharacterized protein YjbI with pentapeptide repeats